MIQKEDYWGNLSILNEICVGEMFGEAYAAPDSGAILNDVIAAEDSTVLFLDIEKILSLCPSACPYHTRLVKAWLDSDKELIELINCRLTVSGAENPHLMLIYE